MLVALSGLCDLDRITVGSGRLSFFSSLNEFEIISNDHAIAGFAAIQQEVLSVLGVFRNPVDGGQDVVNFLLIRLLHRRIIGRLVGRMNRQLTRIDQRATHFVQRCFCRLHQRHAHLRVVDGLSESRFLGTQLLGNLQLSRSIRSSVDLHSGRQPLNRFLLSNTVVGQLAVRVGSGDVGIDAKRHEDS